jgi:hypothetical protein
MALYYLIFLGNGNDINSQPWRIDKSSYGEIAKYIRKIKLCNIASYGKLNPGQY